MKIMSKWRTNWTQRKFVNQARKHGLKVTTQRNANELDYLVGSKVTQEARREFTG